MREESSGVVHKKEMNRRKAWKGDDQHNRKNLIRVRGDKRGKGVGGFWVGTTWESNG
jgi:hypothetical protein